MGLNTARLPSGSVAATATTPAQFEGVWLAAGTPALPAETTVSVPRARAAVTADWKNAGHGTPLPRLRFATSAGVGLSGTPMTGPPDAQVRPSEMSVKLPPHLPSTRTAWIFVSGAAPNTPISLFAAAPAIPATCVPCQLELRTLQWPTLSCAVTKSPVSVGSASRPSPSPAVNVSAIMSYPATVWPARSAWGRMPVSRIATTVPAPVLVPHAPTASMPNGAPSAVPRSPHSRLAYGSSGSASIVAIGSASAVTTPGTAWRRRTTPFAFGPSGASKR